jgi:deoxyribose-phosphate aldolase
MVLNIGKLVSRNFQYIETELAQMAEACHDGSAILKVIFENAYLTDELKIVACRIATQTGCDFVKTSTGFAPTGATMEDLRLMRQHSGPNVRVKAAGGVRTLDKALEVREIGCARFGATATVAILEDWKKRLAEMAKTQPA